jgi:hypothetical protein
MFRVPIPRPQRPLRSRDAPLRVLGLLGHHPEPLPAEPDDAPGPAVIPLRPDPAKLAMGMRALVLRLEPAPLRIARPGP